MKLGQTSFLSLLGLILLIFSQTAHAERELTAELNGVQVTFKVPDAIKPGTTHPLVLTVQAGEGHTAPDKIRARIGMPDHGHWITQEGFQSFAENEMTFVGERCTEGSEPVVSDEPGVMCIDPWFEVLYPMAGQYRVRVWLDYGDGREAKTAIDITVAEDQPLNARVVE